MKVFSFEQWAVSKVLLHLHEKGTRLPTQHKRTQVCVPIENISSTTNI